MSILFLLLLAAGPALAGGADCQAVPVGPPMDLQLWAGTSSRTGNATGSSGSTETTARSGGQVMLYGVPSLGTLCAAPPPPAGDPLHGPPAPNGLLRDIPARDVLRGPVRPSPPPPVPALPAPGD